MTEWTECVKIDVVITTIEVQVGRKSDVVSIQCTVSRIVGLHICFQSQSGGDLSGD